MGYTVKTCCEKPLLTPFCPFCGKPNDDPLLHLIAHLRELADSFGNRANSLAESAKSKRGKMHDWQEKQAATYRKKEQQHLEWLEAVAALTAKGSAT